MHPRTRNRIIYAFSFISIAAFLGMIYAQDSGPALFGGLFRLLAVVCTTPLVVYFLAWIAKALVIANIINGIKK